MIAEETEHNLADAREPETERLNASLANRSRQDDDNEDEDDEDEVLRKLEEEAEMEDDEMFASLRERRMDELRAEAAKKRDMMQINGGRYDTVRSEKEILSITTKTERCVVHFSHKDFRRCKIMDNHLEAIAKRHFRTRFVKVDVEDAPFLVEKLKIQVLPCVISFVDGVTVDRLVGFDGLTVGDRDDFSTSALERHLARGSKVIEMADDTSQPKRSGILGFSSRDNESDDDDD